MGLNCSKCGAPEGAVHSSWCAASTAKKVYETTVNQKIKDHRCFGCNILIFGYHVSGCSHGRAGTSVALPDCEPLLQTDNAHPTVEVETTGSATPVDRCRKCGRKVGSMHMELCPLSAFEDATVSPHDTYKDDRAVEVEATIPVGVKSDELKLRWDLLPMAGVEEVIRVLMFGMEKYEAGNWKLVKEGRRRYFNGAIRHLVAYYAQGEEVDRESGLHHLAHATCCVLFILDPIVGGFTDKGNETRLVEALTVARRLKAERLSKEKK